MRDPDVQREMQISAEQEEAWVQDQLDRLWEQYAGLAPWTDAKSSSEEEGMTTTTDTCWAAPLSGRERAELARKLARSCKLSWRIAEARPSPGATIAFALRRISAEMSSLHMDVTGRTSLLEA